MRKIIAFILSASLLLLAFFIYTGRESEIEVGFFGEAEHEDVNVTGLIRSLIR